VSSAFYCLIRATVDVSVMVFFDYFVEIYVVQMRV